jgi:hypothetical protein
LIFVSSNTFSQYILDSDFKSMFPKTNNGIEYEKIYEVDSLSKKSIFLRIKQWGGKIFNSQKAALQSEDLEMGLLMYQGTIERQLKIPNGWGFGVLEPRIYMVNYEVKFNVNFYIKDKKFKVIINNITNDAVSAIGNWDIKSPTTYLKRLSSSPISIDNAGDEILSVYQNNPSKKNGIRLNYTAEMWRKIHIDMITVLSSIRDEVVNSKRADFDF